MSATFDTWQVAGRSVAVSHVEKLYWPEDRLTKGDMLRYYQAMAPIILPYCQDRPVTLHIFPDGIHGFSYYRRDQPDDAPAWLRHVAYHPATSNRAIHLPLIDDAAGLVWLANLGAIEFHLWSARLPDLAHPDQVIFDLDPGPRATFGDVLQAAWQLYEALTRLGLRGYAKTSGGRGLHVYVPLAPGPTFDVVRAWVRTLARQLAAAAPRLIAVAHRATHKGSHITIDYAPNSVGRNTAAPYTLRAHPQAPVSAPITWEEVKAGQIRPSALTLRTMPARLQQRGDLFAPILQRDQNLPALSPEGR
jgi:bifunctional non-homologous end joining protein LigD